MSQQRLLDFINLDINIIFINWIYCLWQIHGQLYNHHSRWYQNHHWTNSFLLKNKNHTIMFECQFPKSMCHTSISMIAVLAKSRFITLPNGTDSWKMALPTRIAFQQKAVITLNNINDVSGSRLNQSWHTLIECSARTRRAGYWTLDIRRDKHIYR